MMTSANTIPQWEQVLNAFINHKKNGWLGQSSLQIFASLSKLVQVKMPNISDNDKTVLGDAMAELSDTMALNAHYLSQKIADAPAGRCNFIPEYLFPERMSPEQPTEYLFRNLKSTFDTMTESFRNANSQLEQIARYGFSVSFEDRGGTDDAPPTAIALSIIDYKGRIIDLAQMRAGESLSGNLTAFNRKDELTGQHSVDAQLPRTSAAIVLVTGALGDMLKDMLKKQFILLKGNAGVFDARTRATHLEIDRLKDVMYSAYSTFNHEQLKEQKLTVIPFRSSHKSVIAQLNKLNPKFANTLSFAVKDGLSIHDIQVRAQHVSDERNKRLLPDVIEEPILAEMQRLAIDSFVGTSNAMERYIMLSYIRSMTSEPDPHRDAERNAWNTMLAGKPITLDVAWNLQRIIIKSGAGLTTQLPPEDFQFKSMTLHRPLEKPTSNKADATHTRFSHSEKDSAQPTQDSKQSKSDKGPPLQKLPGSRDEHIKTIESILGDHKIPAESVCRHVIDAIQPGLYPHFVMHRIESMNHLVRSIRTSQDAGFVKTGVSMILRTIESQWRERPDNLTFSTTVTKTAMSSDPKNTSGEPKYENSWRRRSR